ncbi:MAG: outer membrane beta-barrel protein [Nonlabens sp.]
MRIYITILFFVLAFIPYCYGINLDNSAFAKADKNKISSIYKMSSLSTSTTLSNHGVEMPTTKISQELTGTVTNDQNQPLPYLNVVLYDKLDEVVMATITNEQGKFSFENVAKDYYQIEVSGMGYETYRNGLNMPSSNKRLETIIMEPAAESLDVVTVKTTKPVVDVQPDKTVLNVDQLAAVAGDNTLDLLRRAPGVRLDNDDNVVVEGRSGVTYYINGRQSFLSGEDLKGYLRSLTSDDIESIEIITQPSSKYDAAGAAGIINIILKRVKGQGLRGSIASTLTLGNFPRPKLPTPEGSNSRTLPSPMEGLGMGQTDLEINPRANTSLNLTYRGKQWDVAANLNNNTGRSSGFLYLYRQQGGKIYDDRTNSEYDRFSNNLNLRTDYRVDDKNTIGGNINFNLNDSESNTNNRTPIIDRLSNSIDSLLVAPNASESKSYNLTTNVNYRFADTLGNSFSADLDYGRYERSSDNRQPNFYRNAQGSVLSQQINAQETQINIDIYAFKADYETDLWNGKLATGIKYSLVATDNDFDFFDVPANDRIINPQRSNRFLYDEQIRAAYLNYAFNLMNANPEVKIQLGLRAEQTVSKGDLRTINAMQDQIVERDYLNWFPSGGLTYKPSWKHSWSLQYSRRIQRPSYSNLNPFEFQLNELSSSRGNPFLQQQYIDNLKLSHTFKYKLSTSFSYSYVSDFFAQITQPLPDGGNFLITQNVADQEIYNLSIGTPFKINEQLNGYASAYFTHNEYNSTDPSFISIDQTTYGGYAQMSYAFMKARPSSASGLGQETKQEMVKTGWTAEISGWYSGPTVWGGTYQTDPLGSLTLGVEKKWENWTAKLSLNDVLYTSTWNATTEFPGLRINGAGGSDSRQIRLFLSYSFGMGDVKNLKDRDGSSEDERGRVN